MTKPEDGQSPAGPAWRWVSERGLRLATGEDTLARYAMLKTLRITRNRRHYPGR